jgi:uncharacterized membrane protein YdjX (TVP38/TMEM64 family)
MGRHRRLLLLALIAGLVGVGILARSELGIEFSRESVESLVSGLGWKASALFVGLVSFRQFLGLPSMVVLSAGGAVFGAAAGTALGALGITISAIFGYSVARGAGREWLRARLGARADDFQRRADAAGPFIAGVATAHPAGPMTAFHWGSGLASVPVIPFVLGVAIGSPIRAFLYSFFGSTLFEPGAPRFMLASLILLAVALLPLAHPASRSRLLLAVRPLRGEDGKAQDAAGKGG